MICFIYFLFFHLVYFFFRTLQWLAASEAAFLFEIAPILSFYLFHFCFLVSCFFPAYSAVASCGRGGLFARNRAYWWRRPCARAQGHDTTNCCTKQQIAARNNKLLRETTNCRENCYKRLLKRLLKSIIRSNDYGKICYGWLRYLQNLLWMTEILAMDDWDTKICYGWKSAHSLDQNTYYSLDQNTYC